MAYTFQKDGRGPFFVAWRTAAGKWRRRKTTATTKREADRLAREVERTVERQELGLDPLPSDLTDTLWDLCRWWLDHRCPAPSRKREEARLRKHVERADVGRLQLRHVRAAELEDYLRAMVKGGAAPASANKLRGTLHVVFKRATKAGRWVGANPVDDVETFEVAKGIFATLRPEEIEPMLAHTPASWRGVMAAGIFLALRKGEILSARKEDVDARARLWNVRRSWERTTSKGGHHDGLPIPSDLWPFIAHQLKTPGPYLFPWEDGRPRSAETDPHLVLRRALARAGIVEGWRYVCRRCKAAGRPGAEEERAERAPGRKCATCGFKLWEVPVPRHLRFHDLRHSTATILLARGEPIQHVQRILRHARISTTVDLYGHLIVDDLRPVVEGLTRPLTRRRAAADEDGW